MEYELVLHEALESFLRSRFAHEHLPPNTHIKKASEKTICQTL